MRRVLSSLFLASCSYAAGSDAAPSKLSFEKDVRPILKAHCFHCHGENEKPKGGVDLRLVRSMKMDSESGKVLVPGKPAASVLFQQIRDGEMPKEEKKLSPQQIATIERWIASGAKTLREEPKSLPPGPYFSEEDRQFWSFQPVKKPAVPKTKSKSQTAPIDTFLLAKMEPKGLAFAPEADRKTLIRRAYYDLLGLPPSPEEVEKFAADSAPDAYEKLLDRLLASPQYGERWARHWLDVAGYADSNGFSVTDSDRPYAYKYRDYIIRSLNADKPIDQFIIEQLAGDELVKPPYEELKGDDLDKLVATGFLRMAPDGTGDEVADAKLARNEVVADTIRIVSSSLMGLTVGCAQCHDHRYDPIPQSDYYRMRAVFEPAYDWKKWRKPAERQISMQSKVDREKAAAIEAEAAKMDEDRRKKTQDFLDKVFEKEIVKVPDAQREAVRKARNTADKDLTADQKKLLREHPSANVRGSLDLYDPEANKIIIAEKDKAAKLRETKPAADVISVLTEPVGAPPKTFVFNRGDHDQPKQEVNPGGLTILDALLPQSIPEKDAALQTSGRRLAFAKTLTDPRHPLTARVLVNRVWMLHFGSGIVRTPGDFGTLGERPTHPELLDWLASEFVASGWKLKALHKTILLSAAYRQSAQNPKSQSLDPDNRLLARANLKRLDAETLRDSILACSGKLNPKLFGSPMPIAQTKEGMIVVGKGVLDGNGDPVSVTSIGDEEFRRSLYAKVRRTQPVSMLDTFDAPAMRPNCEARCASTVAPQSLLLMNDTLIVAQAKFMAERLRKEFDGDVRKQITRAWKLLYLEEPSPRDIESCLIYLAEQSELIRAKAPRPPEPKKDQPPPPPFDPQLLALSSLCQALMSANRFLYVD